MTTLITGSAGNLGRLIARHMLTTNEKLHLMIHKKKSSARYQQSPQREGVPCRPGQPR